MNHRSLLIESLKNSQKRNPQFSLRSMAKKLSLSPAHLSQLLAGKRPLTMRVALKISEKFEMTDTERAELLNFAMLQSRRTSKKSMISDVRVLEEKEFEVISEWYYFAILSLGKIKNNQAGGKWISKQLGLSFGEASSAYQKLKELGYIEENNGQFRQTSKPLHTTRDIPSPSLRKYHKQNLDLAKDAIDSVPVKHRDFTSITMAIDSKKLPRAKKMLHEFKNKICKFLEQGDIDDVYTLAIQLFPVTTKTRG